MSERAAALANQVREAAARLIESVRKIDDAAWAGVPEDGVWSPGKDAEHVTQGAAYHQWLVRTAALGEMSERTATASTQRDIMVALTSKDHVLELLQLRTEQSAVLVASLSDEQLRLPAPPLGAQGAPRTVAQLIEDQMIRHYHEHRENIQTKLAAP